MFEVSFLDWLEKYGTVGTLVFLMTAVAGTFWIWTFPKAFDARKSGQRWPAVCITPSLATIFFFASLLASSKIVSGKKADLDRAGSLVDGNWSLLVQACHVQVAVNVNRDAGVLTLRTADRFTFVYEIDVVGDNFVQAHPRGSTNPSLFDRNGARLTETPLVGEPRELMRC